MSDVDVVILDIDGGVMLRDCLASVAAQTLPPRRVIVFDNGSRTPTPAATARSETNLGFAGGMNEALAHSEAPLVALVNNDVILDPDWLAVVVQAMQGDERLAAVQTVLRAPDGSIDGAGIDLSDGTIRQSRELTAPAWGVSATAALYRRAAIGMRPFDERFFAYYEDVELCARLREGGWRLAVLPEAKATHRGSASAGALRGDALRLRTRNRYFVARLHRGTARIASLLWEDVRLALRGQTSLRGIIQGVFGTMNGKR
jgi:GT2 family glycosyltransferase